MADSMQTIYDLCIIGAGMIGSSAARHASVTSGIRVCLIGPTEPKRSQDSRRDILGAYYDEGRITRSMDPDSIWAELNAQSKARYRQLEKDTGVWFYQEVGCLLFGREQGKYIRNLQETAKRAKLLVKEVSAKYIKKTFPALHVSERDVGLFEQNAGYVNPRRMVLAQQTAAHLQGCDVITDVVNQVTRINQSDGSTVTRLDTSSGRIILAKKVLLATGAFTAFRDLLPNGVVPDLDLMTQTVVLGELSETDAERLSNLSCMSYNGTAYDKTSPWTDTGKFDIYFLPPIRYPDGKVYMKIGHGLMFERSLSSKKAVVDWFCNPTNENVAVHLTKCLRIMFPDVTFQSLKTDTCVTSVSRSHYPYIDLICPWMGVALGGCGYAAKSCDEIGRIAADLIIKGSWEHDLPREHFRFMSKGKATADASKL